MLFAENSIFSKRIHVKTGITNYLKMIPGPKISGESILVNQIKATHFHLICKNIILIKWLAILNNFQHFSIIIHLNLNPVLEWPWFSISLRAPLYSDTVHSKIFFSLFLVGALFEPCFIRWILWEPMNGRCYRSIRDSFFFVIF